MTETPVETVEATAPPKSAQVSRKVKRGEIRRRLEMDGSPVDPGKTPGIRRRMLDKAERSLWDMILPLALSKAEDGDWDAARFVVAVLRDPLLGGIGRRVFG